jgi:hypothetical protein
MTRCSLNQTEQREFASRMERKQMKEFMTVRPILPEPPVDGIFDIPSRCNGTVNANAPCVGINKTPIINSPIIHPLRFHI